MTDFQKTVTDLFLPSVFARSLTRKEGRGERAKTASGSVSCRFTLAHCACLVLPLGRSGAEVRGQVRATAAPRYPLSHLKTAMFMTEHQSRPSALSKTFCQKWYAKEKMFYHRLLSLNTLS